MKTIKTVYTSIGTPIRAALKKKYNNVADYMWSISNENKKELISKSKDSYGMIPIPVGIVFDHITLVNEILYSNSYEVMSKIIAIEPQFRINSELSSKQSNLSSVNPD